MKFQPDTLEGVNTITRHEPQRVAVGAVAYEHSVLVPWVGSVERWAPAAWEELRAEHFERIVALKPEVVILGTGARLRFAPPAVLRPLIEARIGIETMDTGAACRTYNVLAAENRRVLAALLLAAPAAL